LGGSRRRNLWQRRNNSACADRRAVPLRRCRGRGRGCCIPAWNGRSDQRGTARLGSYEVPQRLWGFARCIGQRSRRRHGEEARRRTPRWRGDQCRIGDLGYRGHRPRDRACLGHPHRLGIGRGPKSRSTCTRLCKSLRRFALRGGGPSCIQSYECTIGQVGSGTCCRVSDPRSGSRNRRSSLRPSWGQRRSARAWRATRGGQPSSKSEHLYNLYRPQSLLSSC
jgi:hypothetical protein